jgi:cell division protein FtsI (penicillin-binding protein 3)
MSQPLMQGQKRLRLVMALFLGCFIAIHVKLATLAIYAPEPAGPARGEEVARIPRPAIVDRNGQVLATDIRIPSLYADPRKIIDVDEAVELLTATLPDLNASELRRKLSQRRAFVWVKRELTEKQRDMVHDLGLPGLGFRQEIKRIYPMGKLAAHVLGYTDVDSRGLAGIEKYLDGQGALFKASLAEPDAEKAAPAQLSIDVRVQHALTDELNSAMALYQAVAAAGIVMDVRTGEVVAAVSLPDYSPNDPRDAQKPQYLNRFTGGAFELGSVVKTVTFAMALDAGTANLDTNYDARAPISIGRFRIDDFHPERRILTLPEVFTYSSNIGTVHMAEAVGEQAHEAFLRKIGFYDKLRTEIPEAAGPILPKHFSRLSSATISYGHGISIEPMQMVAVTAGLLNGGNMIEPTFLKRSPEDVAAFSRPIISGETSEKMRFLFRLNATSGTGSKADVPGYRVGGKTGTAEKVVNGGYSDDARLNSYLAAFPMENPQYVMLVLLDEPKPTPDNPGKATAGFNAVPTSGRIIARIAPTLGIKPELTIAEQEKLAAEDAKLAEEEAKKAEEEARLALEAEQRAAAAVQAASAVQEN